MPSDYLKEIVALNWFSKIAASCRPAAREPGKSLASSLVASSNSAMMFISPEFRKTKYECLITAGNQQGKCGRITEISHHCEGLQRRTDQEDRRAAAGLSFQPGEENVRTRQPAGPPPRKSPLRRPRRSCCAGPLGQALPDLQERHASAGPHRLIAVKALTRLRRFAPALRVTAPFRRGDRLRMEVKAPDPRRRAFAGFLSR